MFYSKSNDQKLLFDNTVGFINAASKGDVKAVAHYLDTGIHPDKQNPYGWTALRMAAAGNHYQVAVHLINRGADVNASNGTGKTALLLACARGHHDMVSLLLFYGADPNIANVNNQTPLMIASRNGFLQVVGALLDIQPRIDLGMTDKCGRTAYEMAIRYGHDNVAKMLWAAMGNVVAKITEPCIPHSIQGGDNRRTKKMKSRGCLSCLT